MKSMNISNLINYSRIKYYLTAVKIAAIVVFVLNSYVVFADTYIEAEYEEAAEKYEQGKEVYNRCIACHSFTYNRTGPKHCGLFGRKSGALKDFEYSKAMRESNIVWDKSSLNIFLASPLTTIPGTNMGFAGISDKSERDALIEYMKRKSVAEECK